MTYRDMSLAIFAALIWGATFPISAIALTDTPPIFFTALRFVCAAAFIVVVPRPNIAWHRLAGLGVLLGAGQYGAMFIAMSQGMPAGLAAVLVHTQAVFTVLIAMVVLSERPTSRTYITLALATCGLVCLAIDRTQGGVVFGFALMIVAALSAACGNIILKTAGKVDMLSVAVWMSLAPIFPLLLLSGIFEGGFSTLLGSLTWTTLAAAGYSAVFATVVAYTIWGRLFVIYSTAQVAPFFLLVPVIGLALSAVVLGERFSRLQLSGSALIFLGLVISILPSKQTR